MSPPAWPQTPPLRRTSPGARAGFGTAPKLSCPRLLPAAARARRTEGERERGKEVGNATPNAAGRDAETVPKLSVHTCQGQAWTESWTNVLVCRFSRAARRGRLREKCIGRRRAVRSVDAGRLRRRPPRTFAGRARRHGTVPRAPARGVRRIVCAPRKAADFAENTWPGAGRTAAPEFNVCSVSPRTVSVGLTPEHGTVPQA